jgi:deoxyribonuclease V
MPLEVKNSHRWDLSPRAAIARQRDLAQSLIIEKYTGPVEFLAAADVAFPGRDALAAVCLFTYPHLELLESHCTRIPCKLPYIPGLLSFREAPALIEVFRKLSREPDIILIDGQGIAHPRRLGIASHIGLLYDKPTIGCAKSRLCGQPENELRTKKGAWVRLLDNKGKVIGAVVRSRDNVKPLYVSPGHRISLEQSVEIVLSCCRKYRIPEPLKEADRLSKNPVFKDSPEELRLRWLEEEYRKSFYSRSTVAAEGSGRTVTCPCSSRTRLSTWRSRGRSLGLLFSSRQR